ncbi:MAG: restriction endonuclease subunit S [Acidithiobacillus sp.]
MPENWRSYPIRELAANAPQSFTDGDWIEAPHIRETGIRLIQTGNIGIGSFIDRSRKYISQASFDALHCKEVRPGDLLICRLAEPIGRACFAPDLGERMITSVDVTILRVDTESFDPRFVSFCINTPECLRQCETVSGGTTRQRISRTNLGKVELKAPSVGVQRRIAEILSTLDEAIEQTEALIAKHQQIKAGLMHDLFTLGITSDGHLRPTREQAPKLYKGSPLGWIPKEWGACPIESILDRIIDYRGKTPTKTIEGIPLITAKNVRMGYIDPEPKEFIAERDYPTWMIRGIPVVTGHQYGAISGSP